MNKILLKLTILVVTLLLLIGSKVEAQTATFNVVKNNFSPLDSYAYLQLPQTEQQFSYYNFSITPITITGTGYSSLTGKTFLGFCVNTLYNDPTPTTTYSLTTDGSNLTYDIGNGNYWATNTAVKYAALRDIFAYYASTLNTLKANPTSQAYADLSVGIGMAISEIVIDYTGSTSSMDLYSGNSQVLYPTFLGGYYYKHTRKRNFELRNKKAPPLIC